MHQPTFRVLQVLEQIARKDTSQRLTDISRELGIPKSTLLPILQTLCQQKYLAQDDLGRYSAGVSLFSLGTSFSGSFPVLEYARQQLDSLVEKLGETCFFGTLDGGHVLYLEKVESPQPLRMLTSVGRHLPAYATGIGKALLCDHSPQQLQALYPQELTALTEHTVTDLSQLSDQLRQMRQAGYTWECEESTPHVRCFAVPIRKHGAIVAAISVTIPLFRYNEEDRPKIIHAIQAAAAQMSTVFEQTNAHFGDLF